MNSLESQVLDAVTAGHLLKSSADNIFFFLKEAGAEEWEKRSLEELVEGGQWTELNDRFYKTLSFGTGGLRGRSIGKVATKAEWGNKTGGPQPQYPAVGTNSMNFFNVSRATQGLLRYMLEYFTGEVPRLVVSHDTRYFSRQFAELIASVASQMGVDAFLFPEDRSTPELSFAVRYLKAHAGVMVTASHNPPHDNGYKVYFQDGGQIVEPHASKIISRVLEVKTGKIQTPAARPGKVALLDHSVDDAYIEAVSTLALEPGIIREQKSKLKLVYTPIHGTGIRITPRVLEKFGFNVSIVPEQAKGDGGFPTVKSPNPENAEALSLGLEQAKREGADLVLGTDPDADRMGVVIRDRNGEYQIITGNMIGSIMAAYRLERFFARGILTQANASHAVVIKTFVTTDLQRDIAAQHGVRCVDTLTGFKYIGEKLKIYEEQAGGRGSLNADSWRDILLKKSSFYVFGGEESYGYSGGDYVRDKDANAAVLMFAEAAAYAASKGMNLLEYLDALYLQHGYYSEKLGTLTFEGAEGAAKIRKLLESYKQSPPENFAGKRVERIQNFAEEDIKDIDGKAIPKELMLMFYLEGGFRIAVRGSGTEPKIKYYFFGKTKVQAPGDLPPAKEELKKVLDGLWEYTQENIKVRVG
ncbi:MAG: phospho-sugar mutase [Methylacidiphilales bacterium]|nr:phospho-sugar mutase [Candidatus Methylacidiphilales bacterium]